MIKNGGDDENLIRVQIQGHLLILPLNSLRSLPPGPSWCFRSPDLWTKYWDLTLGYRAGICN